MKTTKIFKCLLLFLAFILVGCQTTNIKESKEPFTVHIFFSQTCPRCKLLREHFVARLKEEFKKQVTIVEYDIDLYESQEMYYDYIGIYDFEKNNWLQEGKLQIDNPLDLCDENKENCNELWIPMVIVGDMYAFTGYNNDYLEEYINDVHLALQQRALGNGYTKDRRWEFKK